MTRDGFSSDAASPAFVDLRSDTVTRPTEAMYAQMRAAPLGDDGLDGDPTARALEETAAAILGKEAGLFVPSCTMGNLLAILAQVQRSVGAVSSHQRSSSEVAGLSHSGILSLLIEVASRWVSPSGVSASGGRLSLRR